MKKHDYEFWDSIRNVVIADTMTSVPDESLAKALSIFQPVEERRYRNILSLRPAFGGMVRRADTAQKLLYELNSEYIVQLEKIWEETGYLLSGFAHGFDDSPVILYGNENVYETTINAGSFELEGIPQGTYTLSFTHKGEDYWITNLELKETAQH